VRYIVDTDVLIDLSRAVEPVSSVVRALVVARQEVAICVVQIAEFFAGVPPLERALQGAFLRAFAYWDVSRRAAIQAGAYRYDFARLGIQLKTPDALIAAVAREHSAVIVTRNARDFPMTDVRVRVL
jgi:predicted nucleic acid-binding protein